MTLAMALVTGREANLRLNVLHQHSNFVGNRTNRIERILQTGLVRLLQMLVHLSPARLDEINIARIIGEIKRESLLVGGRHAVSEPMRSCQWIHGLPKD